MTIPAFFMLRLLRHGPLTPGRYWLDDAEPGVPDNKLDRGRLSIYPRAEVAGREFDPERIVERDWAPLDHWKSLLPISAGEYRYRVTHLAWTRRHRPADPVGRPDQRVAAAELPLPDFDREQALVG